MIIAPKQWSPLVCIILASIILSAGCKTTSWTSLPGMSYFAKDEAPAASYYGSNGHPTNDYTSPTPATTNQPTTGEGYYNRQYNSTDQGTSDYLGNPPQTGPQYNSAATEQPIYDGQRQQYQSYQAPRQQPQQQQPQQQQPQQYQTPQQQQYQPYQPQQTQTQQYQPYQAPQQQQQQQQQQPQTQGYQPYQPQQQPIANPTAPGATSLQRNPTQYNQGFYDPNAASTTPTTPAAVAPPTTTPGNNDYILSPNAGTNATSGAAAYTAGLPNQSPQFDGTYNPVAPAPPVQPSAAPYRPGSTGDANSYYAPVAPANTNGGGSYNGR
ncbi:MAG: hypothetical protein HN617_00095 [Planctomycetaceae bacterium]|nr:hypothetical protein [Planctomycetaceae bacterium]